MNDDIFSKEDDMVLLPRSFKFISTKSKHFKDNFEKLIKENSIWITLAKDFNDPMELSTFYDVNLYEKYCKQEAYNTTQLLLSNDLDGLIKQAEKLGFEDKNKLQLLKNNPTIRDEIQDFICHLKNNPSFLSENQTEKLVKIMVENHKNIYYDFIKNTYIYCLTSNIYNSAMWAYYADNHEGIAIEFYKLSPLSKYAQQIYYTTIPPKAPSYEFDYLITKNIYWKHEEERRFFDNRRLLHYGEFTNDNFYKFLKNKMIDCNNRLVKTIYLGMKIEEKYIKYILNSIKQAEYPIRLMLAFRSNEQFNIDPESVKA